MIVQSPGIPEIFKIILKHFLSLERICRKMSFSGEWCLWQNKTAARDRAAVRGELFSSECNDRILLGGTSGGDDTSDQGEHHGDDHKDDCCTDGKHCIQCEDTRQ